MRIGCDVVSIEKFTKSVKMGGDSFLRTIFLPSELKNDSLEHLAGIFAAKEAVIKTLDLPPISWLEIEIQHYPSGRPKCRLVTDISISHDKDYAIAFACKNI